MRNFLKWVWGALWGALKIVYWIVAGIKFGMFLRGREQGDFRDSNATQSAMFVAAIDTSLTWPFRLLFKAANGCLTGTCRCHSKGGEEQGGPSDEDNRRMAEHLASAIRDSLKRAMSEGDGEEGKGKSTSPYEVGSGGVVFRFTKEGDGETESEDD